MVNKKILFISIFVFMIVLSIGAVSAHDADDAVASSDDATVLKDSEATASGSVSGGVDVATENPWTTQGGKPAHGELSYDVPADAKTIKSADVYVNIYGASTSDSYGANANITISTANGDTKYNESLCIASDKSSTVYKVNDHVTKSYLDYMIHYNVTSLVQGLNGTNLKIKVDTFNMTGKTLDGRIKLIALVLAYDDGDDDVINYWINDNQIWTDSNATLTFDTTSLTDVLEMSLTNIALSSTDATYKVNGEFLTDAEHKSGGYYQYNKWDITDYFNSTKKTQLLAIGGVGIYGSVSHKNALSVLVAKPGTVSATVSLATERKSTYNIVYPGTFNQIAVTVNTNKNGNYIIQLLADGEVVNTTEVKLTAGTKTVNIVDPSIRPIDSATVYDGSTNFNNVTYTVKLLLKDELINQSSLKAAILYNGYFNKDYAYLGQDYQSFYNATITGDFKYLVSENAYTKELNNRTDSWTVTLPDNSTIVKAFIYLPVGSTKGDNAAMYNVVFNDNAIVPSVYIRDQTNAIGINGYGLMVFDVTDLVKVGANNFALNKTLSGGVYSPILIYLYNTTGSNVIKNVYITNGADLLGTYGNAANRPLQVTTTLNVDASIADGATAYIFGAGSRTGRATIIINGEENATAWDTNVADAVNVYEKDIFKTVKDANDISIVVNKDMFVTLQQVIVTETVINPTASISSIKTERKSTYDIVYPGTYNKITVNVNTDKHGTYTVKLYANGELVNTTEFAVVVGDNSLSIIDPTIRPINSSTVYVEGGNFTQVNYTAELIFENEKLSNKSLNTVVLFNGYFNKDYEYLGQDYQSFYNATITGDFKYLVSENGYASELNNRTDSWTVTLPDNSTIVKAFIYLPVGSTKGDNAAMYNVVFNNKTIVPSVYIRDQTNAIGINGYGLMVFDVTDLVKVGANNFALNKTLSGGVYSPILIYLYNTTGSNVIKNVYITNGADLLGTYGNAANRPLQVNTTLNVDASEVHDATAYIFGAGSKTGRATIIINGEENATAWDTSADSAVNVYEKDITKTVKDANDISIVLNKDMFTTLQQIIVITEKISIPADEAINVTNPADTKTPTYSISLPKDATGNFTVAVDGKVYETKELVNGSASITVSGLAAGTHNISISYSGDDNYSPITKNTTVTIKDEPVPPVVKKATKITAKKKTFKAKKKVKKYAITLKSGKTPVKSVKVTLKIGKKTFKAKTNKKGKAVFKIKKLTKKGKYKAVVKFAGNSAYKASSKKVKITLK